MKVVNLSVEGKKELIYHLVIHLNRHPLLISEHSVEEIRKNAWEEILALLNDDDHKKLVEYLENNLYNERSILWKKKI